MQGNCIITMSFECSKRETIFQRMFVHTLYFPPFHGKTRARTLRDTGMNLRKAVDDGIP